MLNTTPVDVFAAHGMRMHETNSIEICGFSNLTEENCFCVVAAGHRYHEFGIADGSVLLCSKAVTPQDGDIVTTFDGTLFTIYVFRPGSMEAMDGEKRIIADRGKIYATVLGSFNYYR